MEHAHFPTTEAALAAIREVAKRHGRTCGTEHSIGADQSARRTAAGAFAVADADGSLPHEVLIEIAGPPAVEIEVFSEGDAHVTVDGVTFHDLPRHRVPAFLDAVWTDTAFVKGRRFPPGEWLVVPLPGDETYKELIGLTPMTPWLARAAERGR